MRYWPCIRGQHPRPFRRSEAAAEEALSRLPEGYRIVAGHAGLEFVPVEALKSAAIERFMGVPPSLARQPVFIGDDISGRKPASNM